MHGFKGSGLDRNGGGPLADQDGPLVVPREAIAVISNRRSGRNADGMERLRAEIGRLGVHAVEPASHAELAAELKDLARKGVKLLAINGGDGTLDTVLTSLRRDMPFASEPVLAVLRGGTTNMVARDVGLRGTAESALRSLVSAAERGIPRQTIVSRRPVRLTFERGGDASYGFFFTGAAIPRAILQARRRYHPKGLKGPLGEALALGGNLLSLLRGGTQEDSVLRPDKVDFAFDGGPWQSGSVTAFYVTSLKRLILGVRPPPAEHGLALALLHEASRRETWRALPQFLLGRAGPKRPGGPVVRREVARLDLRTTGPTMLDGELFDADAGRTLTLEAAKPVYFVKV